MQAQKWVERLRERRQQKMSIFSQLMATRQARISPEDVRALNMIDIVFYGSMPMGRNSRTKSEQAVLETLNKYRDHLNVQAGGAGGMDDARRRPLHEPAARDR